MSLEPLFRLYFDGDRSVGLVILDCARLEECGLAAVERIARAQLEARRLGHRVALRNAGAELLDLIWLCGLDVLSGGCLRVEVQGQTE